MLEVEYEYRTKDGELVKETDATRVEMLARNEAVFSDMRGDDQAGFHDLFSNIPALMAAYVNGTDPVMQQLAGWRLRNGRWHLGQQPVTKTLCSS